MTLRFDYLEKFLVFAILSLMLSFDLLDLFLHPWLDIQELQILGRRSEVLLQISSLYPLDKLQQSRRCLQTPGHAYFLLLTWCYHVKYWYTIILEEEVGDTTNQLCSVCPMERRLI